MPTLTITRGLPGSGKSTWARRQPGWRVNRDDLRAMATQPWPYGNKAAEDALTAAQHAAITALLLAGIDVICDDTNLSRDVVDQLRQLAYLADADFVVHDLRHLDIGLCIARDAGRSEAERVGADVIRLMAAKAGLS